MKKTNLTLLIAIIACTLHEINADATYTSAKMANQPRRTSKIRKCKCYCSYKCGLREMEKGDSPFIDEETGICFCQQRDKDKYVPHGCDKDVKPKLSQTCCKDYKTEPKKFKQRTAQPVKKVNRPVEVK